MNIPKILALPPDELRKWLLERLVPKPWLHNWTCRVSDGKVEGCDKCKQPHYGFPYNKKKEVCSRPDPIALDWNLAMKMRDEICRTETGRNQFEQALLDVASNRNELITTFTPRFTQWVICSAQPHHYILAAVMAGEGA